MALLTDIKKVDSASVTSGNRNGSAYLDIALVPFLAKSYAMKAYLDLTLVSEDLVAPSTARRPHLFSDLVHSSPSASPPQRFP